MDFTGEEKPQKPKIQITTVAEDHKYFLLIMLDKQMVKERIPRHVYNMEDREKRDSMLKEYVLKAFQKAKRAWGDRFTPGA